MKKRSAIIVAIVFMMVGFAAVSTTLIINGNAKVSENADDFSVIFTKASLDGKDVYSSVVDDTKKTITFTSKDLMKIGDTSTLTYEVTNNSANYDAEVRVTCVPEDGTTAKYTSIKNELEGNATIVKAKETLNGTLTVNLDKQSTEEVSEKYTCKLEFNAVEREELGKGMPAFQKDSWEKIAANVKSGNTSKYKVGDTKTVTIVSHTNNCSSYTGSGASYVCNSSVEPEKELTVRISNMSECTNGETSETACGFVVEFVDIIEKHNYNKATSVYTYGTNIGGWKDSELRRYISNTIFNSLPTDLQNVIISTKVTSSHGSSNSTNFETQDKLYLLNSQEVYGSNNYDTSVGSTKQLDYYKNKGVTASSYDSIIKQYNNSDYSWWLRSSYSANNMYFISIYRTGAWSGDDARYCIGISPAFRIG